MIKVLQCSHERVCGSGCSCAEKEEEKNVCASLCMGVRMGVCVRERECACFSIAFHETTGLFCHCNHQLTHSTSLPSTKIHHRRNSRAENFTGNEASEAAAAASGKRRRCGNRSRKEFFNKLLFWGRRSSSSSSAIIIIVVVRRRGN